MPRQVYTSASAERSLVDEGLRSYLQKVYAYMGLGLALTGFVAYLVASTPALYIPLLTTPLRWVVLLATLAIPFVLGFGIQRLSFQAARGLFGVYAGLMGVALSSIFLAYTGDSIARIFLVTSCTFGGMSLYGYTTQKDLSSWGSFLFMGVLGVVLASVVNLFMQSSALQFALSVITVLVFTGLTAYDTQMIRNMYDANLTEETRGKMAVFGALQLYLDFVNIFLSLLRLFGDRR